MPIRLYPKATECSVLDLHIATGEPPKQPRLLTSGLIWHEAKPSLSSRLAVSHLLLGRVNLPRIFGDTRNAAAVDISTTNLGLDLCSSHAPHSTGIESFLPPPRARHCIAARRPDIPSIPLALHDAIRGLGRPPLSHREGDQGTDQGVQSGMSRRPRYG